MKIGDYLKKLRKKHNMSQEDLAKKLHVSRQAIYKWESNRGYPDIENLIQLSEVFDVTIDEIIKNDGQLRKKIKVDEKQKKFNDPSFYLGLFLIFIGAFSQKPFILFFGLAIMIFYDDLLKLFKVVIKDIKGIFKE